MERDIEQPTAHTADNHAQPTSQVSEHSTTTQQDFHMTDPELKGKPSVIEAYCRRHVIDREDKAAIWFCMQRGRKWVAKDVHPTSVSKRFGIDELRKYNGWWKRHSMFSAVGVKEVKMRFVSFDEALNVIQVVIMDFDYDGITKDLNECIQREVGKGVGIIGVLVGSLGGTMSLMRSGCLPCLSFTGRTELTTKGLKFLESNNFVASYRSLQYDIFAGEANPYGRTINAFKVIEGWHPRYMLSMFAGSVLFSLCIVALVTTINGSFEIGFTAGSYALALATMIFAVLTLLSAVL
ncbi:hypothetical protein V496_00893 [Pseudogymnoascus sp. VKM F-4515 (FW-2607)]|nr:hypothetical protein V496_00893 [Pseudogymnoascus sp. VKM F-4515 (FW-2607)]